MGVQKTVVKPGNGSDKPKRGDEITFDYEGFIYDSGTGTRGEAIDSSNRRGALTIEVGTGKLMKGFDVGILETDGGMSLGEGATLIITSDYAYGTSGFPGTIPPNTSLIFDIDLLAINGKRA